MNLNPSVRLSGCIKNGYKSCCPSIIPLKSACCNISTYTDAGLGAESSYAFIQPGPDPVRNQVITNSL